MRALLPLATSLLASVSFAPAFHDFATGVVPVGVRAKAGRALGTSYVFRVDLSHVQNAASKLSGFDVLGACSHDFDATRRQVDVVVLPEELAAFRGLGLPAKLVARGRPFADIAAERAQNAPLLPPDANYFTVAEIIAELARLENLYPAICKRIDVTQLTNTAVTHNKNRIYALKISDNVAKDEGEPASLIAAQHHARELNTPYMVIQAARRILAGYPTDPVIKAAVDEGELWLVPCVNPDGVDYVWTKDNYWRKNRRDNGGGVYGVDPNRNYPWQWGKCGSTSSNPRSQTYRGPSAGSEPETKTMMALARRLRFEKYLDVHSYGREVLNTTSSCTYRTYASNNPWIVFETHFRTLLANAMGYKTRFPSASGEAQEWHWAENGSLSYLVEVGDGFQPTFSKTVAEEKNRFWPGLYKWLALDPAVRGRVESLKGAAPLSAQIDTLTFAFKYGEHGTSRASDGRYHLWSAPGALSLRVTAPAHRDDRRTVVAPAYGSTLAERVQLIPKFPDATLSGAAQVGVGKSVTVTLTAGEPGKPYWIPISLMLTPEIQVGPRKLGIAADGLFFASALDLRPLWSGQAGKLDAQGNAAASLWIPPLTGFIGLKVHAVGLTFEDGYPAGVKAITGRHTITITR